MSSLIMNKVYKITISAKDCHEAKNFIAILSEDECLDSIKYYTKYNMSVECLGINVSNESNYDDLVHWLRTTKLFKTEFVLINTIVRKIHLPKEIVACDNILRVDIGKHFINYTHDDCVLENNMCHWILSKFKTAIYDKSRNKFIIENYEECSDDIVTSYSYRSSIVKDNIIIVTEKVYNKITVEI